MANWLKRLLLCTYYLIFAFFGSGTTAIAAPDLDPDIKDARPVDPIDVPFEYTNPKKHFNFRQFIVKFHEGTGIRLRNNTLAIISPQPQRLQKNRVKKNDVSRDIDTIVILQNKFKLRPFRHFHGSTEEAIERRQYNAEAVKRRPFPDLNLYFSFIRTEDDVVGAKQILAAFRQLKSVQAIYIQPIPKDADIPPETTIDLRGSQGYTGSAPNGIDSVFANSQLGGRGTNVRVIDIETGWTLDHEDLGYHSFSRGINLPEGSHGTAVLGVMVARDNSYGITGIVPNAEYGYSGVTANFGNINIFYSVAGAVDAAMNDLRPGDVMLIEQHYPGPLGGRTCPASCGNCSQYGYIAMEYWQAEFDAISIATANNIIVVEAAGNGNMRLSWRMYNRAFNRSFRNSEAILVGASRSTSRNPMCWSNRARRIDLHAWGQNVATLGYGTSNSLRANGDDSRQFYTRTFGGTSSATPIVASAVAALQGINKAAGRPPLSPNAMRDILVNTGTPQATPIQRRIGRHPNLQAAIESLPAPAGDWGSIIEMTATVRSTGDIYVSFSAGNLGGTTWTNGDNYRYRITASRDDSVQTRTIELPGSVLPQANQQVSASIPCPTAGQNTYVTIGIYRNNEQFGLTATRAVNCIFAN